MTQYEYLKVRIESAMDGYRVNAGFCPGGDRDCRRRQLDASVEEVWKALELAGFNVKELEGHPKKGEA